MWVVVTGQADAAGGIGHQPSCSHRIVESTGEEHELVANRLGARWSAAPGRRRLHSLHPPRNVITL
ncbi:Uncharacterised protein [Mycobacteroides abscessus subsp. abscessus]|nr:Uncharacterised protein [Mycobacteroides abscessus subsp. abscessus]